MTDANEHRRLAVESRQNSLARTVARLAAVGIVLANALLPAVAAAQLRREPPKSLTDAEFWEFFTARSEPSGSFPSENFVSNETSFQNVIPTLQRLLTRDGVYLGVGPEQNFTYIANLAPRMAVIVDIRRQNAMEQLMYKALFELSPTRADFVARLFSRPLVGRFGVNAKVADLFAAADSALPSDSSHRATEDAIIKTLTVKHHFALSPTDIASIDHAYDVFYEAGPDVNYGYRPGGLSIRPAYPTYGVLQSATNADSVQMAFLATEEHYQSVRELELANLVIPVVGDFAGPKAIRSIGEYLHEHGMTVTAFYLSNVEQYLFQNQVADQFYRNVGALPIDSTSTFIRSVPRSGDPFGGSMMASMGGGGIVNFGFGSSTIPIAGVGSGISTSMSITDSGGVRTTRTVRDSAGAQVVHITRDSAGKTVAGSVDSTRTAAPSLQDSLIASRLLSAGVIRDSVLQQFMPRAPAVSRGVGMSMGGSLTSGLVSVRQTLEGFDAGRLVTYQVIIAMTKTMDWK